MPTFHTKQIGQSGAASGNVLTWNGSAWAPAAPAAATMAIGSSITSATAGSILFAGASGVLAQDNANLFWDDTNNRLGIGTTTFLTTDTPFHIKRNVNAQTLSVLENTNAGAAATVTFAQINSAADGVSMALNSPAASVSGYYGPNNATLSNGLGDLSLVTISAKPIKFYPGNAHAAVFSSSQQFGIGADGMTFHDANTFFHVKKSLAAQLYSVLENTSTNAAGTTTSLWKNGSGNTTAWTFQANAATDDGGYYGPNNLIIGNDAGHTNIITFGAKSVNLWSNSKKRLTVNNATAAVTVSNNTDAIDIFRALDNTTTVFALSDGMTGVSFGSGFDRSASGAYTIGGSNITTLTLGRTGQSQVLAGNVTVSGSLTISDGASVSLGTTSGTAFGTSTSQKLSFYGSTPIAQGAGVADATGGAVVDTEARAAINALISRMEALGLIATA